MMDYEKMWNTLKAGAGYWSRKLMEDMEKRGVEVTKYRKLRNNEIFRVGDEYCCDNKWKKVGGYAGCRVEILDFEGRRPIKK